MAVHAPIYDTKVEDPYTTKDCPTPGFGNSKLNIGGGVRARFNKPEFMQKAQAVGLGKARLILALGFDVLTTLALDL